ncbi:MAG: WD40 repeat domain-containing protein, partial [bacterium]|nr:WD40 repeat domain-containing protein [bacterium]
LITVRRSTKQGSADLELVHESLLVAWSRFARWLEGSHEEREFLEEIEHAAELWQRHDHRTEELWQGEALREAEATVKRLELDLPKTARLFLDSSRQRSDRRDRHRRMLIAGVFVALSAIAAMLGVQRHEARSERDRADQQRLFAERGQADALREGAKAAWLQGNIFEARCKLRRSLEILDSTAGRALWWQLESDPLRWRDPGDTLHFQVTVSADGRLLAASGADAAVTVFDTRTRDARLLTGHDDATLGVAFSPDGHLLAAGTYGGEVIVWSLADGQLRKFSGHDMVPWYLVFSADSSELVSASYDGTIRIWNVATGNTRAILTGHEERIRRVRLSPDGRTLASGSYDGTIRLWDLASASHIKTLTTNGPAIALAWNDDGSLIVSGGSDGPLVQVWDVERGEAIATMDVGHSASIESLDFSPDGQFVASGSRDWTVRVWDVASGAIHRIFDGHEGEIHVVRFSPEGDYLAVTSANKGLRLWNLDPPARPLPVSGHTEKAYRAAFSPDGSVVATSSEDDTVRLWNVSTGEVLRVIAGHESDLFGLAFSPDGRMLVTTGADRTARLWDAESGELLRVLRGHQREVVAAEFAPDGRLATASVDGVIRYWDPTTWTVVAELSDHNAPVIDLDFSADGRFLASSGYDGTVRLWSTVTLKQVRVLTGHEGNVHGVHFEPDGRHLVSTSYDGTLRRWSTSTGESRILERFDSAPYFHDIGGEGRTIAVPIVSGEVFLLDQVAGERTTLVTHSSGVSAARFSPGGEVLATTGADGTLLMTRVADGRPLWRAPALMTQPPVLLNHLGLQELVPGALADLPADAEWLSAVENRARLASQSEDGQLLCLVTWDGLFELWHVSEDRVLYTDSPSAITRLVAVPGGCLSHSADGQVRLVRADTTLQTFAEGATAIGCENDEIFVATGNLVSTYTLGGEQSATIEAVEGISAIARMHGRIVVGTSQGPLLAYDEVKTDSEPSAMRTTPLAPVTRIGAGPSGTMAVGFANGEVALWDLETGGMLMKARLHGEINHLAVGDSGLVAASELGQTLNWDLSSLVESRAEFLRRIRTAAPAVWENGRPVVH